MKLHKKEREEITKAENNFLMKKLQKKKLQNEKIYDVIIKKEVFKK